MQPQGSNRVEAAYNAPVAGGFVFEPPAAILSSKDVAAMLGRNRKTIERHTRNGEIPGHFRLGRWYYFRNELDAWLKAEINSPCQPCRVN